MPGAADPAPVRSYSLSSAPGANRYRLSIKRESHGLVSRYLHASLRPGAVLEVAAPRGDFVLADGDRPVLLISAGIGVTPVLAMLHQLAAQHSRREIWWIHGARGPAEHPLAREARDLIDTLADAHEHVFYSAATPDGSAGVAATHGRLTAQALTDLNLPIDAVAYLCGPAAFMTDMSDALTALGLAQGDIHTERFGALGATNPGVVEGAHGSSSAVPVPLPTWCSLCRSRPQSGRPLCNGRPRWTH